MKFFIFCFFLLGFSATTQAQEIPMQSGSVIVVNQENLAILYEKNAQQKFPIASTVKIVTAYRVLEAIHSGDLHWETRVRMNADLARLSHDFQLGSYRFSEEVEYTIKDLFQATLLISSNSATIQLGILLDGDFESNIINTRTWLNSLGLEEYTFVSSSGLELVDLIDYGLVPKEIDVPREEVNIPQGTYNEFSASDIAKIAYQMMVDFPEIIEIIRVPSFTNSLGEPLFTLNVLHDYIREDVQHFGLKTGFTPFAG